MDNEIWKKLKDMKCDELKAVAKKLKLSNYSKLNKKLLINLLLTEASEKKIKKILFPTFFKMYWKKIAWGIGLVGSIASIIGLVSPDISMFSGQQDEMIEKVETVNKKIDNLNPIRTQELIKDHSEIILKKIKELQTNLNNPLYGDEKELKEAKDQLNTGNADNAQEIFSRAVQRGKGSLAKTYHLLASAYLVDKMPEYKNARDAFKEAVRLDPENPEYLNDLGYAYYNLAEYDKAEEFYKKAILILEDIKDDPESSLSLAHPLNNMAGVWMSRGNCSKALCYYEKSLAILRQKYPNDEHELIAANLNNIGTVYSCQNNYQIALEYFEKALLIDSGLKGEDHMLVALRYTHLGHASVCLKDYENAYDYFEKALNIVENKYDCQHHLTAKIKSDFGVLLSCLGDHGRAIEYCKNALELRRNLYPKYHPNIANAIYNLGLVYQNSKKYYDALDCFMEANVCLNVTLGPDHPNTISASTALNCMIKKVAEYQTDAYLSMFELKQ